VIPRFTYSEYACVSDCKFIGGDFDWTVTCGPQNAQVDERSQHLIFERNWFTSWSVDKNPGHGTQLALRIAATRYITVRNNLFDLSNAFAQQAIDIPDPGVAPTPQGVFIYNNTVYSSTTPHPTNATTLFLYIDGFASPAPSGVIVKNKLGYAPSSGNNGFMVVWNGPSGTPTPAQLVQSNNSYNNQLRGTNPNFVVSTPTAPADFKLAGTGYAIAGGIIVPVLNDFFIVSRLNVANPDMGFSQFTAGTPW